MDFIWMLITYHVISSNIILCGSKYCFSINDTVTHTLNIYKLISYVKKVSKLFI